MTERRQKVERGYCRTQEKAEVQQALEEFYDVEPRGGGVGGDDPGLAALMAELEGGAPEPEAKAPAEPAATTAATPRSSSPRNSPADPARREPAAESKPKATAGEPQAAAESATATATASAPSKPMVNGPMPSTFLEWARRLWSKLFKS